MTDSTRKPEEHDDDLRPIPDGGLGTSLPDWLKDRPSWSHDELTLATLPPDTSPIDPRTLVRDEDLPEWLRAIAGRETDRATLPDLAVEEESPEISDEAPSLQDHLVAEVAESPKPEWITHATPESVIPADSTVDMQHWLSAGEVPPEKRKLVTNSVLAAFILAIAIIIAVALYLWFS